MKNILKDEEYQTGIKIQDFPSKGRVSRIKGRTTGRLHHLLSDLETNIFYLLDYDERVVDIKEHYPLLDLTEIDVDLDNIDLKKFENKKTGEQYMFTTSFVVTLKDIKTERYLAITVKNESQLYKSTTLEKLEVERRYWRTKGIDWCIVTNKDILIEKVENIKWLLLGNIGEEIEYEKIIIDLIKDTIITNSHMKISKMLSNIGKVLNINEANILSVLKKLIVNGKLVTDLDKKILLTDELIRFEFKDGGSIGSCIIA